MTKSDTAAKPLWCLQVGRECSRPECRQMCEITRLSRIAQAAADGELSTNQGGKE